MNVHQTFLNHRIHCCAAADEIAQFAAESISQSALNAALQQVSDERNMPERADSPFAECRIQLLFVNLFYHQWYRNNQIGLDILHRFKKNGRGRGFGKEVNMGAGRKGV